MNDASEVKLHFLDYWRIIRIRAGLVVLTFLLVLVTAGITTYFLPREYYSKVTMEVKPDNSGSFKVFNDNGRGGMDPMFVPTQFQIIQKKEILNPVVSSLKLNEEWSKRDGIKSLPPEYVYNKLLRMLDLKEVRNTGLIEIGVYSVNPQEAADIANTIAVVYKDKRRSDLKANTDSALAQLRDEMEKQRKRVEEASTEMAQIRERDNIVDPDPESPNAVISPADRNIVAIEQQLNEQRLRVTKLEGQFEQIMKMKPEELREVLRTLNIEDQTIIKMVASLQDATAEEAKLYASGLADRHPRLNAVRSQKDIFLQTLANSLNSVRQNQASLLEIERRTLAQLETKFKDAQERQIEDKKKTGAYIDSKTRYLQAKKIFEAAQIKYSTELLERGIDFDPSKIWEKAEASNYPAKPKVAAYMILAAIVGGIFGIGLAFFIEYLDTSVKTLDDVEKYLNIPVLAVVRKDVASLMNTSGDSPDAEAYRILRANLEFNKPNRSANVFTLVSGGPGEGKSTTLNNLAFTCALGGYNVLVVDADIRRPSQHRFFEIENTTGLVDYLRGKLDLDDIVRPTKLDNLSFVPSGMLPDESVGILNSQRMVDLIARVKGTYDLVFFDSPPILGVSDGSVLASECDATIMVIQHRRFPRAMLLRVKQAVVQAGGKLIGAVLNNVDSRHDEGYSYNSYYNDYYRTHPAPETKAKDPSSTGAPAPKEAPTAPRRSTATILPADAPAPPRPIKPQAIEPKSTVTRPQPGDQDEY